MVDTHLLLLTTAFIQSYVATVQTSWTQANFMILFSEVGASARTGTSQL
jgi:hypothetical protein